jgi:hypothetical protein
MKDVRIKRIQILNYLYCVCARNGLSETSYYYGIRLGVHYENDVVKRATLKVPW